MKLNDFHAAVLARQNECFAENHHTDATLALAVVSEVGELADAVVGSLGCEKRKASLGTEDVLDAIGDSIVYLSLLASCYGCDDLEALLTKVFNHVSKRAGSKIFLPDERVDQA